MHRRRNLLQRPEICVGVGGDPGTGCASAGPPCDNFTEVDGCPCETPVAVGYASRYLSVTPLPGSGQIALVVTTCAGTNPQYVGPLPGETSVIPIDLTDDGTDDGTLAGLVDMPAEALWLTPTEWGGTVCVTGLHLVPGSAFDVQADCGSPVIPNPTAPTVAATQVFGDVNADANANFTDVLLAVQAFQQSFLRGNDKLKSDQAACHTDQVNNFVDILHCVQGFQQGQLIDTCS